MAERATLQMDVEPDSAVEKAGDLLGVTERRVRGDLENFKRLVESRGPGGESGGWRGEVGQSSTG